MYWAGLVHHCRAFHHWNEQPYSHLVHSSGCLAQHRFSPAVRRQQLDAACDSHRTHRPSSPSCCRFSSSASLVIRDSGHRCRPGLKTCNTVLFVLMALATVLTSRYSARLSISLRSAHSISRPMFLEPKSSSRVLDHMQSPPLRNQIVVARTAHVQSPRSRVARRSPALLLARLSVVEAYCSRLGDVLTRSNALTQSQVHRDRSGRRDTPPSTRVTRTGSTLEPTFTQECRYSQGAYNGEGAMQQPPPRTPTIYYDDVSSGPHPKAHWYMLTHQCCSDTAPYWTPHHAAQSSGPIPMPLQCLSTSNHPV